MKKKIMNSILSSYRKASNGEQNGPPSTKPLSTSQMLSRHYWTLFYASRGIKMKRYWCISTSAENWKICKENGVWGMDARYYVTLHKFLKDGDQAIVYIHGGKFIAVVEFAGDWFYEERDIGWTKEKKKFLFPYRIKFRILHEAKEPPKIYYSTIEVGNKAEWVNPNLIDNITFIADKGKTWNQYLQVSIIRITKEDFDVISNAIKRSQ